MVKSVARKVAWMARATTTVVGLAIMLALVVGVATTALGATDGNFLLGRSNKAETPTSLSSTLQRAAQSALVVINKSGGPALDLRVGNTTTPANDVAPLKVNSSKTVTNLSADRLDGEESAAFQRRVSEGCEVGSSIQTIGADGTVTCEPDDDSGAAQTDALRTELGADDGLVNQRSDPVSFSKVKNVPTDVVGRNADTLDGRDSEDFAAAGHRHSTVVRTNSTVVGGKLNTAQTLSVQCLPGEVATGGGGGFTQAAGQEMLHVDEITVTGQDSRGDVFGATTTVEDNSWANGGLLGSYPMKVVNGNAVIAGAGEPAEAWGVSYIHEKFTARDVKVWVVCHS